MLMKVRKWKKEFTIHKSPLSIQNLSEFGKSSKLCPWMKIR